MKKLVSIVAVVAGAAIAQAALVPGSAAADSLTGKTYSEVAAKISEWDGKAIIKSVIGSRLPTDECVVTNWHRGSFRTSSGGKRGGEFLLTLNCNARVAGPGVPGNSAVTAAGKQAKKDQEFALRISKNPAGCQESAAKMEWCQQICAQTGLCKI